MAKCTMCGARSTHKLSIGISFLCPSWMDFINTLGEGNKRDLDLDRILGDFYINYDNQHEKNEKIYNITRLDSIID
jgi:hypothetical protein